MTVLQMIYKTLIYKTLVDESLVDESLVDDSIVDDLQESHLVDDPSTRVSSSR